MVQGFGVALRDVNFTSSQKQVALIKYLSKAGLQGSARGTLSRSDSKN